MSVEKNKELVQSFFQDINENIEGLSDVDSFRKLAAKYMAPEYILHTGMGDLTFEQDLRFHNAVFVAFPDLNISIEDIFGSDDRVFARLKTVGTHKGVFHGVGGQLVNNQGQLIGLGG